MAVLAYRNCAAKIWKFSRISEKSATSAKDMKNPRRRIKLVNYLLQIGFSSALPSSSISASSFDLKNYTRHAKSFRRCGAEASRVAPDREGSPSWFHNFLSEAFSQLDYVVNACVFLRKRFLLSR